MVLQRGISVPVWGWSVPGSKIIVQFAGQTRSTVADSNGHWKVKLKPLAASTKAQMLTVTNLTTHSSAQATDVLVGDVWLCSGQSNMEMGLEACGLTNEIVSANFPQIRFLTVPRLVSKTPVQTMSSRWIPCDPESIRQGMWGGFSAVAFFFGRELHHELNVPIGLIHSSWGGTVAEAWTSYEGLKPVGDFNDKLSNLRQSEGQQTNYPAIYEAWCRANDPGTREGWERSVSKGVAWQTVSMPQNFEQAGLPNYDGMVWFQREFELPDRWIGSPLILELGTVDDVDTTWVNGIKVGQMNQFSLNRRYSIPAHTLKAGRNTITIRVLDTGGVGGLTAQPSQLRIAPTDMHNAEVISLAGPWQMRASASLSQLGPIPPSPDVSHPNTPTVLYNGMIAPLLPFAIKGVIWYQGESNADRAHQYQRLLPAMIRDWRKRFEVGDFPFYIVQLAAFQAQYPKPRDNAWAELREAQALTATALHNCGLAVAIDVGDAKDIHPKDKLSVGRRLALCALAQTYEKQVEYSGPQYHSMKQIPGGIRLRFKHAEKGLSAHGDRLTGFAIAGADRKFVWAEATIEGNEVFVSSPQVSKPVAVRYAWDINPNCNLYNVAGLPAVPFRTDQWPGITGGAKKIR